VALWRAHGKMVKYLGGPLICKFFRSHHSATKQR
jgi:hypothetical protein